VRHVIQLADGSLASVANDDTLRFWDLGTDQCKRRTGKPYDMAILRL